MRVRTWKVGELARETGLTIRTLHHYDDIGLLRPSLHTEAGHRLYTTGDVQRLQQIVSLRQIGLSLEEVRGCLDNPEFSPLRVIEMHLDRLEDQMALQRRLRERLGAIADRLRKAEEVSAEEFIRTIEETNMVEQYYTPEQLEQLRKRKEQFGEEHIRAVEKEWPELMAKVRAEMDKGTDPTSEPVQVLARRWQELVNEFTGGDAGIEKSLGNLWKNEGPNLAKQHGYDYDPKLFEYVGKAIQALKQQ